MNRNAKWLTWLIGAVATIIFAATILLYSRGLLPVGLFWWQRRVSEPSSEDYAAYSGFVDGFFSSDQPFRSDQSISADSIVFVTSDTLAMRNNSDPILPLDVVALGPEDMGKDFFRQNSKSWHLEARFRTRLTLEVVDSHMLHKAASSGIEDLFTPLTKGDAAKWLPHSSPAGPFLDNPKVSGVLQLSRLGFDHRRVAALVYYNYRCGILCGQSGWAALRKAHGMWKLNDVGRAIIY